ncbi:MAG TPA: ribonuclease E inhibitor RraB [Gaiellaceae bacterium]|nr:ribonuclease E inhibitor RraB [Gaiellaceae bacterium]
MPVGYAVYRIDEVYDERRLMGVRVVWDEKRAEELVQGLNATSKSRPGPYAWREVWVDPNPPEGPYLSSDDRNKLLLARAHDVLDTERPVSVFFSFIFAGEAASEAAQELRVLGWPDAGRDEELEGDECWHVYGLDRRLVINSETIAKLRADMESLANRLGGEYDGWDLTGGHGLRSELGKLRP